MQDNKQKTVIVVGAGASNDFRYKEKDEDLPEIKMPTGEALIELMKDGEGVMYEYFLRQYLVEKLDEFCTKEKERNFSFTKPSQNVLDSIIDLSCLHLQSNSNDVNGLVSDHFSIHPNERGIMLTIKSEYNRMRHVAGPNHSLILRFIGSLYREVNYTILDAKSNIHLELKIHPDFKPYFDLSNLVQYYNPFSIDEFLDSIKTCKIEILIDTEEDEKSYRAKLVEAGKVLIAIFLMQYENKSMIDNICWYRHLRNTIITCAPSTEEIIKKLKSLFIISFNYDRSLDYFLRTRLREEFYNAIKGNIIYPYGELAEDNFIEEKRDYEIEYGKYHKSKIQECFLLKNELFEKAQELGKNIRVIGEDVPIKDQDILNELFKNKKNLQAYFLGFAFHPQNCEVINLNDLRFDISGNANFYYTNFNSSKKVESRILNFLNDDKDLFRDNRRNKFISDKGVYDALMEDFDLSL